MNKKALLKKYLLISNFYKKPFPYSLLKELGFSKSDIPASYMVRRDYVFNKDYNNSQIKQLTQSYKSETRNKKKLAQIFLFPLYILPFVYMIGISGSVAMETPEKKDDIDIYIICDHHALWLTRIIDFVFYTVIGKRRTHILKNKKLENKFCINKYQSLKNLHSSEKDIYTALQILSIIPIWGKSIKRQLLGSNRWIAKYSPRFRQQFKHFNLLHITKRALTTLLYPIIIPVNLVAKLIQINLLKKNPPDSYHFDSFTIETYNKKQSNKLKAILNKDQQ